MNIYKSLLGKFMSIGYLGKGWLVVIATLPIYGALSVQYGGPVVGLISGSILSVILGAITWGVLRFFSKRGVQIIAHSLVVFFSLASTLGVLQIVQILFLNQGETPALRAWKAYDSGNAPEQSKWMRLAMQKCHYLFPERSEGRKSCMKHTFICVHRHASQVEELGLIPADADYDGGAAECVIKSVGEH